MKYKKCSFVNVQLPRIQSVYAWHSKIVHTLYMDTVTHTNDLCRTYHSIEITIHIYTPLRNIILNRLSLTAKKNE